MKIILLLVSTVVVFAADPEDLPGNSDGGVIVLGDGLSSVKQNLPLHDESLDRVESQTFVDDGDVGTNPESHQNFPLGADFRNSEYEDRRLEDDEDFPAVSEVHHQLIKEREVQNERRLRGSQCSANAICGIVGGSCIGNLTNCNGWLVSEGCKGSCKCCIPRSQEMQMTIFRLELQWLKEDLVNSSLQLKKDILDMIENVNNTNTEHKKQLSKELDLLKTEVSNNGCPEGLFWFSPSDQCFVLLNKTTYNWQTANQKCSELGLVLAKPFDPNSLRHHLISRYGTGTDSWVGAQGTGSITKWTRDGQSIATNSILWYNGYHGKVSSSYCLVLATHPSHEKNYPNAPYWTTGCANKLWAVCEYVRE